MHTRRYACVFEYYLCLIKPEKNIEGGLMGRAVRTRATITR